MSVTASTCALTNDLERDVDKAIRRAGSERQALRGVIFGQREITAQRRSAMSVGYERRRIG